jgi:signal transduction histidine kinase
MLYKFLVENREKILARVKEKVAGISEDRPSSAAAEKGLPEFYAHVIAELKKEAKGLSKDSANVHARKHGALSTALHGKELSRLGYTVSQVVRGYGVICQAITEVADAMKIPISAREFSVLNLSLDVAIADAVTGFTTHARVEGVDSTQRMGELVHELRNALAAATVAHSMVKKGVVGTGGSTNALLERNLIRMRDILDRSFAEVRMQNAQVAERRPVRLIEIADEVEATAGVNARERGQTLKVEVDSGLQVDGDHNYLISALSNLVQNAIKYSNRGGIIRVRSRETSTDVVLEVEDQCGGLPKGKAEELFKPYTQKSSDRTGLGLGLSISRQAVALNGGTLEVRNAPGKGCVFSITLPKSGRPHAPASGREPHALR